MDINFYKIEFANNDLILINMLNEVKPSDTALSKISRFSCKRRTGIGANGVVFLLPGDEYEVSLRFFLPNGNESLIINDAQICAGRYLFDSALSGKESMHIETQNGIKVIDFIDGAHSRVSIGKPLHMNGEEVLENPNDEYINQFKLNNRLYSLTPLRLQYDSGIIFFQEDPGKGNKVLADHIINLPGFSEPLKPIFVNIASRDEIICKTMKSKNYSEKSITAGVSLVASVINGFTDRSILTHINKKKIFAQWSEENNEVYVTGAANYVYTGNYYIDDDIIFKE